MEVNLTPSDMATSKIINPLAWKTITLSPTWTLSDSSVTKTFPEIVGASEVAIISGTDSLMRFTNVGQTTTSGAFYLKPLSSSSNYDEAIDGGVNWQTGAITLREGLKGSLASYRTITKIAYRK